MKMTKNENSQELQSRRVEEAPPCNLSESRFHKRSVIKIKRTKPHHLLYIHRTDNHAQQLRGFVWDKALRYTKDETKTNITYSDTTSGGKLWGTDRMFSHKALSLVHVQDAGHRGCFGFLPSAKSNRVPIHSRTAHPLTVLFVYPIL